MKPYLYPDLETYSDLDIRKVSLDRYAAHPSTRILMCSYAFDEGPIHRWEEGQPGRADLIDLFRTHTCIPWNTGFERSLTEKVWKLTGVTWWDAMVVALYCGLPAGLKDCNRVPFFRGESKTSKEVLLINKFCKPQKDGSKHGPDTDPEDWAAFGAYCDADVFDTRMIFQWLTKRFDIPARVLRAWHIDQAINHRGMPVDKVMTLRAWDEAQRLQAEGAEELKALTGLENPNSPAQLLQWVTERGYPFTGLGKELVKKALNDDPGSEDIDVDD